MSKQDIINVMDKLPELTNNGIEIDSKQISKTNKLIEQKILLGKRELLNSIEAFNKTVVWLSFIKKVKNINKKRTSYDLKHIAEKSIGYISNGVFIAAAVHSGFNYKYLPKSLNASFNMSEKSIKQLEIAITK